MEHEDRVKKHAKFHSDIANKLNEHDGRVAASVDKKNLEKTYSKLEGYELVFRKKAKK